jgi:metallo-beta-lactamase family protein
MSIEIQFLGAVGCVTGSQFLVTAGERRVLIDCGMFQGSPDEVSRNRLPFSFEPEAIDALLVTHAHLDHVGRVPALVKQGYRGPIIATHGTVELGEIVMRDAAKLQAEAEARWRRHHPDAAERAGEEAAMETDDPSLPERIRHARPEGRTETRAALYAEADVDQAMRQARGIDYDAEVPVLDGISAVFHDAGHILGSAIIELRVADGDGTTTIVFSGDLGRDGSPILRDPAPLAHADYVLVESTYGNRGHEPHEQALDELVTALSDVATSTGVMLIPAFAIGRTQELIWILDELVRQERIPRLPLFLDSPMASRATVVYRNHPEAYDEETHRLLDSGDSPLEYPGQEFTDTVERSKAIRTATRPFMIVASSGMLTGGRIMHHLKDFLPDPASTLLFIGYQGEGTLGRHLADGGRTARIDGQEIEVKCRVRSISGFSAHADEHELEAWMRRFAEARNGAKGARPPTVFVVHGDPDAAEAFATTIRDRIRLRVHVPTHLERVVLRG